MYNFYEVIKLLDNYYTTPLEDWVDSVYEEKSIYCPADIDEEIIADSLDIIYSKCEEDSNFIVTEFLTMITVDSRLSSTQQREQFFHELCHVLRHAGKQTMMMDAFRELQESQTKSFQLYATMPFSMIRNLVLPEYENEIIDLFSSKFKVSTYLASQRLEQIKRRLLQSKLDYEFKRLSEKGYNKADPANWSYETKALLQVAVERKLIKEGAF